MVGEDETLANQPSGDEQTQNEDGLMQEQLNETEFFNSLSQGEIESLLQAEEDFEHDDYGDDECDSNTRQSECNTGLSWLHELD